MKCMVVLACVLAVACANPGVIAPYAGLPLAYSAPLAVAAPVAIAAPAVTSSQYHAQDELGQYSYGYAGGPSAKHEVKTFDGVTRGGYSYVDAHGLVQSANYVADPVHGFRVAATNLPVAPAPVAVAPLQVGDSVDVAIAKAAHFAAHAEARAKLARAKRGVLAYSASPLIHASPLAYAAPAPVAYAAAVPALVANNKYHAQDVLGQYSYGYNDGLSSKHETRTADGITQGGYTYVDSHGLLQTVKYTADPVNGFRVAATNLPH